MEAYVAVYVFAGAKSISNDLPGLFLCRSQRGGDAREGEIEQIADGALPVFDRRGSSWCFKGAYRVLRLRRHGRQGQ